jgi:hypothetical protein
MAARKERKREREREEGRGSAFNILFKSMPQ